MKQIYTTLDMPNIHRFAVGFDHMFDNLHRTAKTTGQINGNFPPYNIVKQSETLYTIEVAVAGFTESELEVEVINNELVVKGMHINKEEGKEYLHQGISARDFIRMFALADNVVVNGASVQNGILTVNLDHVIPEAAKPTKIAIAFQK